ncbi:hypothetical protein D3C76_1564570 [compost metagenome]
MHGNRVVGFKVGAFVNGQVVAQLDRLTPHPIGVHLQTVAQQLAKIAQMTLADPAQTTEQHFHKLAPFFSLKALPRNHSQASAAICRSHCTSSPGSPRATCSTKSPRYW